MYLHNLRLSVYFTHAFTLLLLCYRALFGRFGNKFNKHLPTYLLLTLRSICHISTTLVAILTLLIPNYRVVTSQSQVHIRLRWLSYIIQDLVKKQHKVTISFDKVQQQLS